MPPLARSLSDVKRAIARRSRALANAPRVEKARRRRLRAAQASTGLLLDVGARSSHLPGWISLDIDPDEETIRVDASKPWPFPDGCARAVRAEHMIEHLSWDEAAFCAGEMARVLEAGGLCRICTPDLEGISRAYLDRDPRVLDVHREHGYEAPTWAHLPNNYLRMWGHRFLFDFDALRSLLERAGFQEIERAGFNQSRHELLAGTDSHDPGELEPLVVCVDAVKAPVISP